MRERLADAGCNGFQNGNSWLHAELANDGGRGMRLRVSMDQYERLRELSEWYDVPIVEIVRKALRKWRLLNRRGVYVENTDSAKHSTYGGEVLNLDLSESCAEGFDAAQMRGIIRWYCDQQPTAPPDWFETELRAGVDYLVEAE